jgi:hypothetical protein
MKLVKQLAIVVVALAVTGAQALAATILVTNPANLGANASATIAPLGTDYSEVAQGTSVTLTGDPSRSVAFSNDGALLSRVDEGGSWGGNFLLDEALLWSGGFDVDGNLFDGGTLTLTFNAKVQGVGARIQRLDYGTFGVTVKAFNGTTLLGSFLASGLESTGDQDGSAPFIGIRDTAARITSVTFSVSDGSFAINGPLVNTTPGGGGGNGVPEPFTVSLVGLGLAGVAARRYRSRRTL